MGKNQKVNVSEIVIAAINGSHSAINELYKIATEVAKNVVKKKIFKLSKSQEGIEEEAHQIVCKAILNLQKYDASKAKFETWLSAIAINHCIDYGRRNKQNIDSLDDMYHSNPDEEACHWDIASSDATPEQVSFHVQNSEIILAMLDKAHLRKEQREVILGYYFKGESLIELSKRLKINKSTLAVLKTRGLSTLREALLSRGYERNALI